MKKILLSSRGYYCLIVLILLLAACSKTGPKGATGATGATGAAGTPGAAGPQGTAGPAGSQIFSGNGAPAATIGNVGDYYINDQTDSLYGPKTLSGWGAAISLKGATGATGTNGTNGTNGSSILSGIDFPSPLIGNIGDFYFDELTDGLYGPKTTGGWGSPTSLRGSTGPQGPAGTANVLYYDWVSFIPVFWGGFNSTYDRQSYQITMPSITSDIIDKGVILTYIAFFDINGGDTTQLTVTQVPADINNFYNNNTKESLSTSASTGQLTFFLSDALDKNDPGILYTTTSYIGGTEIASYGYMYRIIIIPGGTPGTTIDPHSMPYQQVCKQLGIQP